jgi:regulator of sigma E protease
VGWVAFFIILCAMVVIHEFGHFIVAKLLGIAVETFSVGFGPRLAGFRMGETDYRLSALPLGGYVKFRGENLEMLQGKSEGSIEEFLAHPRWKRFLVAIAGPVFNIATAVLIPTIAIMVGFEDNIYRAQQMIVGAVLPGSAAEKAGIQKGDRILAYGNNHKPTWTDFQLDVSLRPNEEIPLEVSRGGQILTPVLVPQALRVNGEQMGNAGIDPPLDRVRVARVSPNSPAARAGLQAKDEILAVNGQPIEAWIQFKDALRRSNGDPVTLQVARAGSRVDLTASPEKLDGDYKLGFYPDLTTYVKASSIATALQYGVDYNWRLMRATGVFLRQVFKGQRSVRNAVAGPIGIAQVTAETYDSAGWSGVVETMGMLSLNLGVFNLLPIPVLDGGVILLILIEGLLALKGMTLTMSMRERFQQVGFVFIILLMGFVFINDIPRLFGGRASEPPAATQHPGK